MLSVVLAILFWKPILFAVGVGVGFGLGRVKNAKKLAAAQAAYNTAKDAVVAEAKKV